MDSPELRQRTPSSHDEAALPAVDHVGGTARLMGDAALFGRVLARFRNDYRQAANGIRGALERGDTPLALRLVHTLKGAAGMIEAVPLRRAAAALEHVLRAGAGASASPADGAHPYRHVLQRLQDELARVLQELDAPAAPAAAGGLPGRPAGLPPARTAVPTDGVDVLARLVMLLDDGNGDAVDLVRDAAPTLAAQLGESGYRAVADAIESFDFDSALALLRASPASN